MPRGRTRLISTAIPMHLQPPRITKGRFQSPILCFSVAAAQPLRHCRAHQRTARQLSAPNRLDVLVNWERLVSRHLTIKLQTYGYWLANHQQHVNYRHGTIRRFKTGEEDYVNNNVPLESLASYCPKWHVSVTFYYRACEFQKASTFGRAFTMFTQNIITEKNVRERARP